MQFYEVLSSDLNKLQQMAKDFQIDPLAVEDCIHLNQRAKLEDYPNHNLLVWFIYIEEQIFEMELVIFPDKIILVTHQLPTNFNSWAEFLKLPAECKDIPHLLYIILDRCMDLSIGSLRPIFEKIDNFEEQMFEAAADPKDLLQLKKHLSKIEFTMGHLPSLVKQIQNLMHPKDDLRWKFRDLNDHCERLNQYIAHHRDQVSSSIDLFWGLNAERANSDLKKLSLLASLAIPLNFWTSFWGMNFSFLPFENQNYFVSSLILVLSIPIVLLFLLKKKII